MQLTKLTNSNIIVPSSNDIDSIEFSTNTYNIDAAPKVSELQKENGKMTDIAISMERRLNVCSRSNEFKCLKLE